MPKKYLLFLLIILSLFSACSDKYEECISPVGEERLYVDMTLVGEINMTDEFSWMADEGKLNDGVIGFYSKITSCDTTTQFRLTQGFDRDSDENHFNYVIASYNDSCGGCIKTFSRYLE